MKYIAQTCRPMASFSVGKLAMTLLVSAVLFSGCLSGPSSEGADGPLGSTTDDDAGPVEVFSPGWPSIEDAVIRPGVKIVEGTTSGDCTANFVFSTPDNRTLYLGTASHCHMGAAIGDPVTIASGVVTGTLVYCAWGAVDNSTICPSKNPLDEGWANDFALVELPEDSRSLVHPALMHWGGPTGILNSTPGANVHVLNFGNSSLRDGDTRGPGSDAADETEGITASPRPDLPFMPAHDAEWSTFARFAHPRIQGDSGSAVVLADGTALGVMTQIMPMEAAMRVTNLSPAIEYIHNNTDLRIELKTFQMLADPLLPRATPDEGAPLRQAAKR